ncbi:MAG: acetylornithine deacetylase/succinyl-diaminopimelate desuccinylase-like protein [Verrucomicrobiales bacterium]|jgi:acetylornithine deacetylase/succinyl-diaminopimelate desuccinylase-like protein
MTAQQRLAQLFDYLRFPSISTDKQHNADTRACADWLVDKFQKIGLKTTLHETKGHPVIVAKTKFKKGLPTVLIYGHYDVQPVDPLELWESPPFEPEVRDGVIFARGSTDNKGQNLAHILGVEQLLAKNGELPVNITFLIEGEEEIGSPNLEPFLKEKRSLLKCDVVAVSDTGMVAPGVPTMTYGLRGIACMEFDVIGPDVDLHSGIYGGGVANPATVAARLVASLHEESSHRVAIKGFYDNVGHLRDWEREKWAALPDGDTELYEQCGVPDVFGEDGYGSYERRWARPTAEVNGIGSGYQGPGSKTVIASKAHVKLSFRLVPNQDPIEIMKLASKHLRDRCPSGVKLKITKGHHGPAYLMDPTAGFGAAAQSALRKAFNAEPMLIREGGSIPIVQGFKDVLGVDTLLLGLALPDCKAHSPNENFPVANFEAGIRMNQILLEEIGNA